MIEFKQNFLFVVGKGNIFLVFQRPNISDNYNFTKIEHFTSNSIINTNSKVNGYTAEIIQIK